MPWWGYEVIAFVVQTDKMEGVTSLRMKFVSKKFLFTKQHHHHRYYHQLTTQNFTIFGLLDIRFFFFCVPFFYSHEFAFLLYFFAMFYFVSWLMMIFISLFLVFLQDIFISFYSSKNVRGESKPQFFFQSGWCLEASELHAEYGHGQTAGKPWKIGKSCCCCCCLGWSRWLENGRKRDMTCTRGKSRISS